MPRSGKEARARLERAALDLFTARGFDAVTTAEIAAAAGVTERTYFRHFPDKREVLFDGERRLVEWVTRSLDAVPTDVSAWSAMRTVAVDVVPLLEENKDGAERLARLAAVTPSLQERAAAKEVHLVALVADRLVDRGVPPDEAALVARTVWGVLTHAVGTWRADPAVPLTEHLDRAFALLVAVVDV